MQSGFMNFQDCVQRIKLHMSINPTDSFAKGLPELQYCITEYLNSVIERKHLGIIEILKCIKIKDS